MRAVQSRMPPMETRMSAKSFWGPSWNIGNARWPPVLDRSTGVRAPTRLRTQRALIPGCTASVSLSRRCRRRVLLPRSSSGLMGIGAIAAEGRSVQVRVIRSIRIPCRFGFSRRTSSGSGRDLGQGFAPIRGIRARKPWALHGSYRKGGGRQREPSVQKWAVGSGESQAPTANRRFVPTPTLSPQPSATNNPQPLSRRPHAHFIQMIE